MSRFTQVHYTEESWNKVKQAYDVAKAEADKEDDAVTASQLKI